MATIYPYPPTDVSPGYGLAPWATAQDVANAAALAAGAKAPAPGVGGVAIDTVGPAGSLYAGYTLAWADDFNEATPSIISPATPNAKYFDMVTYTPNSQGNSPRARSALLNYDAGRYDSGVNDANRGVPVYSWQDCVTQGDSVLSLKMRHTILTETGLTGFGKGLIGPMIGSSGEICARPPMILEARIRSLNNPAASAGYHPSWWTMLMGPVSSGDSLECDWESDEGNTFSPVGYVWTNGGTSGAHMTGFGTGSTVCPNLQDGNWHILGLEILPTGVRLWADGQLVNTLAQDYTAKGPRPVYWMLACHSLGTSAALYGARTIDAVATWSNTATSMTISTSVAGIQVGMAITAPTGYGIPPGAVVTAITAPQTVTFTGYTTTAAGTAVPVTFSWPTPVAAREGRLECDWVRAWRATGTVHRVPARTQPDFLVSFGVPFSVALPSAASVWGDSAVDETLEMIPHSIRAPGGNLQGMFFGANFPTSVTYSGGVLAGTITDQPGTMWFVRSGTKAGETCEVQRFRGLVGPRIMTPTAVNMATGSAYSLDLYADADVGDLWPATVTAAGLPTGLTLQPGGSTVGMLTGTPSTTGPAVITVRNCLGQSVSKTVTFAPRTAGTGTPLGATFFPNFASLAAAGLIGSLDFDDDSKVTVATGISAITGADGTAYTASQGTGAAQPTRVTINGCKSARFTAASTQYLNWDTLVPAYDFTGALTVVVVARAVSTPTFSFLDIGRGASTSTAQRATLLNVSGSALTFRCGGAATVDASRSMTLDTTTTHILVGRKAIGNNGFFNQDKIKVPAWNAPMTAPGAGAAVDKATVGARNASSTYDIPADANIFRVWVFNRFLEDYEVNLLASFCQGTFGTA